ncbi:MAG: NosD domain-containing protein [Promethearchaeota archaeon]
MQQSFFSSTLLVVSTTSKELSESPVISSSIVRSAMFYTPHAPISVHNDSDLAAVAASGNGTAEDPYILEGWNITGFNIINDLFIGIYIHNTTKFFSIRHCWIEIGISYSYGIHIGNVMRNTVTITNTTCHDNGYGIYLENAAASTIMNNSCIQNWKNGITLSNSEHSVVKKNTCYQNKDSGVNLGYSENSSIMNNDCNENYAHGIFLFFSANSRIVNNVCNQNSQWGMYLAGSNNLTVIYNLCTQNGWTGIYQGSGDAWIQNNTCFQNRHGIFFWYSENSTAVYNTCTKNRNSGIYIARSEGVMVTNNTCNENTRVGITLEESRYITVVNNSLLGNGLYLPDASLDDLLTHTITNNRVNGRVLGFLTNLHTFTLTSSYGQLFLVNCTSIVIQNQNCSYTNIGITLYYSTYCQIRNNICSQNEQEGIFIQHSEHTRITNNICSQNNATGIDMSYSKNAVINENVFTENQGYGIALDPNSENNLLYHNIFFLNHNGSKQASDNGTNNVFTFNYWDEWTSPDTNGEGIVDSPYIIAGNALNQDAFPLISPMIIDSDNDGMLDFYEVYFGLNPNLDDSTADLDQDGLINLEEYFLATDPLDSDSDADGLLDGAEVHTYTTDPLSADSDADGIPDGWEVQMGLNPLMNDTEADPDADYLSNLDEYAQGTDPHDPDSDADGLPDGTEVLTHNTNPLEPDSDMDGMPDGWEVEMDLNATLDDSAADRDNDGMPNFWEYQMDLNATLDDSAADRDNDGMPNFWEYQMDLNATNPQDATFDPDGDGFTNVQEYRAGTDPYDADSDNDFFPDNWDRGWWGNPRTNWDNPLTRGVFLTLLLTLFGLAAWSSFVAYKLPRLHQDLKRQFQHFRQLTNQFLDTVKALQTSENLNKVEAAADDLHLTFQACEESLLLAHRLVTWKWLPPFLRPDLTLWDTIFATVKDTYEEFQETRLKRLDAKY